MVLNALKYNNRRMNFHNKIMSEIINSKEKD